VALLLISHNTMMPNRTYELRRLYFEQNQYSQSEPARSYSNLLRVPHNGYFDRLKPDAELLQEALAPIQVETAYISQQIFGNEAKQQHIGLEHLSNLFYERCKLHKKHVDDINHRHLQLQGNLYGAVINHSVDRARRMSNLESQLLQLENAKREEELAFWKDTAELREKLFESAGSYRAAMQRFNLFASMEGNYDRAV
jgi:hypothetical protein